MNVVEQKLYFLDRKTEPANINDHEAGPTDVNDLGKTPNSEELSQQYMLLKLLGMDYIADSPELHMPQIIHQSRPLRWGKRSEESYL